MVMHRVIIAAEILGCSRQNSIELTKRGRLHPLKKYGYVAWALWEWHQRDRYSMGYIEKVMPENKEAAENIEES